MNWFALITVNLPTTSLGKSVKRGDPGPGLVALAWGIGELYLYLWQTHHADFSVWQGLDVYCDWQIFDVYNKLILFEFSTRARGELRQPALQAMYMAAHDALIAPKRHKLVSAAEYARPDRQFFAFAKSSADAIFGFDVGTVDENKMHQLGRQFELLDDIDNRGVIRDFNDKRIIYALITLVMFRQIVGEM